MAKVSTQMFFELFEEIVGEEFFELGFDLQTLAVATVCQHLDDGFFASS
jgi:hypothetical protein